MCTFFSLLPTGLAAMLRYVVFFSGVVFCARKTLAKSAFHGFQIGFKRYKSWTSSSGASASQSVLVLLTPNCIWGRRWGSPLSALFIDFAASQGFYLLNLRSSRSHTPGTVPRIAGFHFLNLCSSHSHPASEGCQLHFFLLHPPGLAVRMMLHRSGSRGFQIGFKRCKSV